MKPVTYITVACPHCDKRHRVMPKMIGKFGNCSRCGESFQIRPREAKADPGSRVDFQLGAPTSHEKEYFIPVSLTSNPMVDKEYERQSRAQTSFLKHPDRGDSWFRSVFVFLLIAIVIGGLGFAAYWFLIRQ